jgi:hypothetical protein
MLGWCWRRLVGRLPAVRGYLVVSADAIEILADKAPEAAKWWRTNTPQYVHPGRGFVFHAEACEIVAES